MGQQANKFGQKTGRTPCKHRILSEPNRTMRQSLAIQSEARGRFERGMYIKT